MLPAADVTILMKYGEQYKLWNLCFCWLQVLWPHLEHPQYPLFKMQA